MRSEMETLTAEAWIMIACAAAVGLLGSLYGVSFLLERELAKIRLGRRAREVAAEHRRKADAIARGESEDELAGDVLVMPIGS
jgi:hypothetical protein